MPSFTLLKIYLRKIRAFFLHQADGVDRRSSSQSYYHLERFSVNEEWYRRVACDTCRHAPLRAIIALIMRSQILRAQQNNELTQIKPLL